MVDGSTAAVTTTTATRAATSVGRDHGVVVIRPGASSRAETRSIGGDWPTSTSISLEKA